MRSERKEQAIDVTGRVREVVARSGIRAGTCTVYVSHTTAGVVVNENADPDVLRDLLATLRRVVPEEGEYRHAEGNSPAHIRSVLTGASASLPVRDGELALGRWQGVFVVDFDGPREREVQVSVVGE